MKRYFIVNEFFGSRVYDSYKKQEVYFDKVNTDNVKMILQDNYHEIDNREDYVSSPLKISMNITKACNLRCGQCFSESGEIHGAELSTNEIFKLFDEMKDCGTFFICIGGGEPFMRPDIFEVLKYGKEKQLAISLVSNGILLSKEVVQVLNTMDLDTVWVSLEGLEKNHDRLRGPGTFEKAIKALHILQKEAHFKKAIRVSLSKYNLNECRDLVKIAEDYQVDIIRFTPLIEFGRAKDKELVISQDQYIDFLNEIKSIVSDVKIVFPNSSDNGKFWVDSMDFGCHCGKEAIWIDELGNYSPCIFWGEAYTVGNIKTEGYLALWKKSIAVTRIEGNTICKACDHYRLCRGGCRARVLAQLGDLNGVDPLCPLKKNYMM